MDRETLPDDSENEEAWCERCQKRHKKYTFTKQEYDRIISEGAAKVAVEVERRAFEEAMKLYAAPEDPKGL